MKPRFLLDENLSAKIAIGLKGYILVTNNRQSMPAHIIDHLAAGRHFPGIISITREMSIGALVAELEMIWQASEAEEYWDKLAYIPL